MFVGPVVSMRSNSEPEEMLIPLTRDLKIRHWPPTQTFEYTQRPGGLPRDMKILIAPPSRQKPEVLHCSQLQRSKGIFRGD